MEKFQTCKICKKPLTKKGIKKGRTMHYGCRCIEKFVKNGGNTSLCRQKKAIDTLMQKGDLLKNV